MIDAKAYLIQCGSIGFELVCGSAMYKCGATALSVSFVKESTAAGEGLFDAAPEHRERSHAGRPRAKASRCSPAIEMTTSSRCHLSPRAGGTLADLVGNRRLNLCAHWRTVRSSRQFRAPASHLLDHAKAQRKPEIEPNRVADDLPAESDGGDKGGQGLSTCPALTRSSTPNSLT